MLMVLSWFSAWPDTVIFDYLPSPWIFNDITYVADPIIHLAFGSTILRSVLLIHRNLIEWELPIMSSPQNIIRVSLQRQEPLPARMAYNYQQPLGENDDDEPSINALMVSSGTITEATPSET